MIEATRALTHSHNKRHGYLGCDNLPTCFLLSFLLHFPSSLAGPGPLQRTFISSVSFEPLRRLLLRSKQTSHFVLSASRCSELDRPAPCSYSTHFRSLTYNPFSSFTTTLERPRVILSRPERKQFVWHRSNRSTFNSIHLSTVLHPPVKHHIPF